MSLFKCLILILVPSLLYSQDQSSALLENVKNVKEIIQSLEIYDQVEKKRLYGAIAAKSAIEFKIQSSPLATPTSTVIGIATDGTIQEMVIRVFTTDESNRPIKQIRKDTVIDEKDWVFEIIDSTSSYSIDIHLIKSTKDIALVEVIHGFFYGHQSNPSFSTTKTKTQYPSFQAPKQDGTSLSPNDTYNRFEIFKKDLSK